ncbi:MAG: DUF2029 domain-containing protein [Candidatus Aenigmarchaeota archaeon]|nr:DUF2029 domain-containing protein [Candidatus Aenigmarchaeota archaeon]
MNAKYIFSHGSYFEWYRSPLMPFMLFVLSPFGYLIAEYAFIVAVSTLFVYACVLIAKKAKFDTTLFYALMLSPFVLNVGLSVGTELLTLSLLMLCIATIHERKSAFFFGLGFLARYTVTIFAPLLLFKRNWKEFIVTAFIIIAIWSPWIAYNVAEKGHPFYSTADSYLFNVAYRDYLVMLPNVIDFLLPIGFYIFFVFIGLYLRWKERFQEIDWMVLIFAILSIISYLQVPVKEPRYLFNLVFPAAYFTAVFAQALVKKVHVSLMQIVGFITCVNFLVAGIFFVSLSIPAGLYEGANDVGSSCAVMSNGWTYLNYIGIASEPYPQQRDIPDAIQSGTKIMLFKTIGDPLYTFNTTFLHLFPIIKETNAYIILGTNSTCASRKVSDKSFIERLREGGENIELCPIIPILCKR